MNNLAVLVSGAGTILDAMLKAEVPVALVLADRSCPALEIAKAAGAETKLVDRREFGFAGVGSPWDRKGFTEEVARLLQLHQIGLVAMAGFMTVFDPVIFETYEGKIINTHPSLLPDFKGANPVQDALDAGVTTTGWTLHYATPELDNGPIIAQRNVEVLPSDTKATLHERIKMVEREMYPQVLKKMLAGND